ncbi:MAG: PDZ domain-containing protein [Aquificaceae bacterium]
MRGLSFAILLNLAFGLLLSFYTYVFTFKPVFLPHVTESKPLIPDLTAVFKRKQMEERQAISKIELMATASGGLKMALLDVDGKPHVVKVGSIVGNYTVTQIERNYIVLSNGQERKAIGFRFSLPAVSVQTKPSEALQAVLQKKELENITADPGIMFRQIRLVPYVQGGRTVGFMFEWVDPQSLFARAGIRAGDVLVSINNQDIKNGEDAFRILQALRNETSLKVSLLRDGEPVELSLRVE